MNRRVTDAKQQNGFRASAGHGAREETLEKWPQAAGLLPFPWHQFVLLVFAVIAVITGTLTALNRAGLPALNQPHDLVAAHGALMVFGFLGTAITLERGVAYHTGGSDSPRWGFVAPLLSGLAVVSLFAMGFLPALPPHWTAIPGTLWAASMATLVGVYVGIWQWQNSPTLLLQMLGALSGFVSMILWALGWNATVLAPSWMVLLVLTIVGERLELARVSFRGRYVTGTVMVCGVLALVGGFLVLVVRPVGYVLLGLSFTVMLSVMAFNDIARRTWRLPGFTGFMGWAMLMGYFWGILGSLAWLFVPQTNLHAPLSTFALDCFDLGLVMSMVIAHVFLIIPAVVERPLAWPKAMWAPLVVLQIGLVFGLVGGLRASSVLSKAASLMEIAALLLMVITMVVAAIIQNAQWHRQLEKSAR